MKYNININQLALFETTLDLKDCAILDYLDSYCSSKNPEIEKQRVVIDETAYTWIDYGALLRNMPLIRIKSKGALTPRIKVLEKEGFIKTKILNGDKLYVSTTALLHNIYFSVHIRERKRLKSRTQAFKTVNATVHDGEPIILKDKEAKNENAKPWSLDDKLAEMEKVENSPLDIIATFIRKKKLHPDNSKALSNIIARHMKSAHAMSGAYTNEQIFEATNKVIEEQAASERRGKEVIDWHLGTVYKKLTK